MKVLFDQGTPVPLRHALSHHQVATAYELGWSTLKNGDLLRISDDMGFEVLVTTDTNLKYQQNLRDRRVAIVVLSTPSWPRIQNATEQVAKAVDESEQGGVGVYPI